MFKFVVHWEAKQCTYFGTRVCSWFPKTKGIKTKMEPQPYRRCVLRHDQPSSSSTQRIMVSGNDLYLSFTHTYSQQCPLYGVQSWVNDYGLLHRITIICSLTYGKMTRLFKKLFMSEMYVLNIWSSSWGCHQMQHYLTRIFFIVPSRVQYHFGRGAIRH